MRLKLKTVFFRIQLNLIYLKAPVAIHYYVICTKWCRKQEKGEAGKRECHMTMEERSQSSQEMRK